MIHRRSFLLPGNPREGEPSVAGNEFVEVPCGCHVCIGLRLDTREVATVAMPCGEEHNQFINEFQLRLKESLVEPEQKPLVDVVEEMLEKLYEERVLNA
jgi:hypothetical protein